MEFNDFCAAIVDGLKEKYPNYEIEARQINKTNVVKKGVSIRRNSSAISPTVYLDDLYKNIEEANQAIQMITTVIRDCEKRDDTLNLDFDPYVITDWNSVKERIVPVFINHERNGHIIRTCPHKQFLDLEVVFYYILEAHTLSEGYGSILITNKIMETWPDDITLDVLYHTAKQNVFILDCNVSHISSIITKIMRNQGFPEAMIRGLTLCVGDTPGYIITNKFDYRGSNLVFANGDICERIAEEYDNDLYILPVSVHEVMVLPVTGSEDINSMKQMVKQINKTELKPEDFLSDSIYYYDRKTKKVSIAS